MTTIILLGMAGLLAVLLLFVAVTKAGAAKGDDAGPIHVDPDDRDGGHHGGDAGDSGGDGGGD